MTTPLEEECPVCFADLRGAQIPDSDPPRFYSKIVGVEIPFIYDGVLFWECPYCDSRFHRFPKGHYLWDRAEDYVKKLEPEKLILHDDLTLFNVHNRFKCLGQFCAIHNPSEHPLRMRPRTFADGIILRICEHGVAHPDPDALAFIQRQSGEAVALLKSAHGCCGSHCCEERIDVAQ